MLLSGLAASLAVSIPLMALLFFSPPEEDLTEDKGKLVQICQGAICLLSQQVQQRQIHQRHGPPLRPMFCHLPKLLHDITVMNWAGPDIGGQTSRMHSQVLTICVQD